MQRIAWFAALLIAMATLTAPAACAASEKLFLVTAALPPLGSAPGQAGFLEQVAREAFRRIGRSVEVSTLPGERALINADAGLEDGDLYRAPGFEKEYPNLVRVPERMGYMEFMAYAKRPDIEVHAWSDLRPYVVAYATGWKIYDRMVKAREVTKVRVIDDLFPLLANDRADIILIDRWQGLWAARAQGYTPRVIEPPLARAEMFMYLHKRHAAIVPELARALADMKADGTYRKISDASLRLPDGK